MAIPHIFRHGVSVTCFSFPFFLGPSSASSAYEDTPIKTKPLCYQLILQLAGKGTGFPDVQIFFFFTDNSPTAALCEYILKRANVFPLRWRSGHPRRRKGRHYQGKQYRRDYREFHGLTSNG
jgi:hypothetical protein